MTKEVKQMNREVSVEQVETIIKTAERALANTEASLARLARDTGAELIRVRFTENSAPQSSQHSVTNKH